MSYKKYKNNFYINYSGNAFSLSKLVQLKKLLAIYALIAFYN